MTDKIPVEREFKRLDQHETEKMFAYLACDNQIFRSRKIKNLSENFGKAFLLDRAYHVWMVVTGLRIGKLVGKTCRQNYLRQLNDSYDSESLGILLVTSQFS